MSAGTFACVVPWYIPSTGPRQCLAHDRRPINIYGTSDRKFYVTWLLVCPFAEVLHVLAPSVPDWLITLNHFQWKFLCSLKSNSKSRWEQIPRLDVCHVTRSPFPDHLPFAGAFFSRTPFLHKFWVCHLHEDSFFSLCFVQFPGWVSWVCQ